MSDHRFVITGRPWQSMPRCFQIRLRTWRYRRPEIQLRTTHPKCWRLNGCPANSNWETCCLEDKPPPERGGLSQG